MANCKVLSLKDGYAVLEIATDQILERFESTEYAKARERASFFNRGGGFDGWTPEHILVPPNEKMEEIINSLK